MHFNSTQYNCSLKGLNRLFLYDKSVQKSTEYLFHIISLMIYAELISSLKSEKHITVKFLFDKLCIYDFSACASKETADPLPPFKNKHLIENPYPLCVTNQTTDAFSPVLKSPNTAYCCVRSSLLLYTRSASYTLYYMDCIMRIKTHIASKLLFIGFR